MRSNTPYEYLNKEGEIEEVYSPSNPQTTIAHADNATKVNNLEITRDDNGVLKIGDTIIPQKKILWSGEQLCSGDSSYVFNFSEDIEQGAEIEIYGKMEDEYVRFRLGAILGTSSKPMNAYVDFSEASPGVAAYFHVYGIPMAIFMNGVGETIGNVKLFGAMFVKVDKRGNVSFNDRALTVLAIYKIIE